MNVWLTADTHLGHDKLWKEGFRPAGFEETVLDGIRKAQPEVLIHLGDVSLYDHDAWHRRLREACPGLMWLVRGNHDDKSVNWYLKRGWSVVVDRLDLDLFGVPWLFIHSPVHDRDRVVVHCHTHHVDPGVGVLISLELNNCQPVNLRGLAERLTL